MKGLRETLVRAAGEWDSTFTRSHREILGRWHRRQGEDSEWYFKQTFRSKNGLLKSVVDTWRAEDVVFSTRIHPASVDDIITYCRKHANRALKCRFHQIFDFGDALVYVQSGRKDYYDTVDIVVKEHVK